MLTPPAPPEVGFNGVNVEGGGGNGGGGLVLPLAPAGTNWPPGPIVKAERGVGVAHHGLDMF